MVLFKNVGKKARDVRGYFQDRGNTAVCLKESGVPRYQTMFMRLGPMKKTLRKIEKTESEEVRSGLVPSDMVKEKRFQKINKQFLKRFSNLAIRDVHPAVMAKAVEGLLLERKKQGLLEKPVAVTRGRGEGSKQFAMRKEMAEKGIAVSRYVSHTTIERIYEGMKFLERLNVRWPALKKQAEIWEKGGKTEREAYFNKLVKRPEDIRAKDIENYLKILKKHLKQKKELGLLKKYFKNVEAEKAGAQIAPGRIKKECQKLAAEITELEKDAKLFSEQKGKQREVGNILAEINRLRGKREELLKTTEKYEK